MTMRESMPLDPFQTEIIEGKIKPLLGESAHMIVTPLRVGDTQPTGARPLPPCLHVLHAYTRLKNGSNKVFVVVRNMSHSPLYLKKEVQIAHVVSAVPVPPTKSSLEMEAAWEQRSSRNLCQCLHDMKNLWRSLIWKG